VALRGCHRFWIAGGNGVPASGHGVLPRAGAAAGGRSAGRGRGRSSGTIAGPRVLFAAGGIALWVLIHAATPSWADPVVCVVAGGLVAMVLMRSDDAADELSALCSWAIRLCCWWTGSVD
jgi:hypothetical protein